MAIPPEFLEELRRRITLSSVVAKRVRLVKKGREFSGLCPFHNEKTPSFFVNDDKAFYNCFGCGAHGDAVSFVINTEGLSFPDAVERLAGEAGLEVPRSAPLDPAEKARRAGAEAAVEAACAWFARQLRLPVGRAALEYLKRRDVGDAEIAAFRLGFAPDQRGALKAELLKQGFEERVLIEAGLLVKPEDGGPAQTASYDRFRGRVMFPIADRRGRVIAFGGRVLGDGQPKYLNSPEGPLFHKGRTLYALNLAREAAAKGAPVIVAEGYMDVVALHRAGYRGAVAPLGTALTEEQLVELWRHAAEPVLCFDGDAAGQRAAARAAVRALPLLAPGKSLRFASLPAGQDPDDLVRQPGGAAALGTLIAEAAPLAQVLWATEVARDPLDTPERRAALRVRLRDHINHIGDRDVRRFYAEDFRAREQALFEPRAGSPEAVAPRGWQRWRGRARDPEREGLERQIERVERTTPKRATRAAKAETGVAALEAGALLQTLIRHPALVDEFHEELGQITFSDEGLDRLRAEIVNTASGEAGLDQAGMEHYLAARGFAETLRKVFRIRQFASATRGHNLAEARQRCRAMIGRYRSREEIRDGDDDDPTREAWQRASSRLQSRREVDSEEPVEALVGTTKQT